MKKNPIIVILLFLVCLQAIWILLLEGYIRERALPVRVTEDYLDGPAFRAHTITEDCFLVLKEQAAAEDIDLYEYLAAAFLIEEGILNDKEVIMLHAKSYQKLLPEFRRTEAFQYTAEGFRAVWKDLKYFPIPASARDLKGVAFENSWLYERSFGGFRGHEGCDIMASKKQRGYYPVLSMTDGVVEKIGWLPQGGYRIGIRSESGGYFYYAHLYEYAEQFQTGTRVSAGQLLGFMGDSGYGEEGTVGKFDVHLHVGIYIKTVNQQEVSVNPYYVLKYLENRKLNYSY